MRFPLALPPALLLLLTTLLPSPAAADLYAHRAYPDGDRAVSMGLAPDWILIAARDPDPQGIENTLGKVLPTATLARILPLVPGRVAVEVDGASAGALRTFGEALVRGGVATGFWPAWKRSKGVGFFDDQLVVATDSRETVKALSRVGVRVLGPSRVAGLYRAEAVDGDAIAASWRASAVAGVRWAQPDLIRDAVPMAVADDPLFGDQWHLASGDMVGAIDAPGAWDVTKGDPDIVIGIFDTGFDTDHPDLVDNIVGGFDALGNDDDPEAECSDSYDGRSEAAGCPANAPYRESHGTAVAGTAAARGDNQIGGAGVCPQCSLYLVRLIGTGGFRSLSNAETFTRAAADGVDVINNSWGPSITRFFPLGRAEQEVFDRITSTGRDGKGVVILFAAGNDFFTPATANPYAAHPQIITVAASSRVDDFACYSNYGSVIAIAAPSQGCFDDEPGIVTADYAGGEGYSGGDSTRDFGGTSAASPVAAGLAGLVLSANPELTAQQVRLVLQASADRIRADKHDWSELLGGTDLAAEFDYDERGFSVGFGYGRINAARAVALALAPPAAMGACGAGCERCVDGRCVPACASDDECPGASRCLMQDDGSTGCALPLPTATDPGQPCGAGCDTCVTTADTDFEAAEICTTHCETDDDCGFGFDCRTLDPAAPRACVPGNQECGEGFRDVRCQSSVAVEDADGDLLCSCDCFDDGPGGCPDGMVCSYVTCRRSRGGLICEPVERQIEANYLPHCVPDPSQAPPRVCAQHDDCLSGEFCVDGTCQVDRGEGGCDVCARCTFDSECAGDGECVETARGKRCLQPCSTADEVSACPADTLCVTVAGAGGTFCVNPDYSAVGYCPDDYRCLEEGRCFTGEDCASGVCEGNVCAPVEPDAGPDAAVDDMGVAEVDGEVEGDEGMIIVTGGGKKDDGCSVSGVGGGAEGRWPVVLVVLGLWAVRRRRG
ncbi:MAG: S8 family serine peptidase [Myxococcales bacterium]|nr:S8 family serine peptidase [Myxococcales bacterium]